MRHFPMTTLFCGLAFSLACLLPSSSLMAAGTVAVVHLTGDQGYIRLAQDGVQLEAGKVYLSSVRVKGYVRPGSGDHVGSLYSEPSVEYSNYWHDHEEGWTRISRLIKPDQTKEYDFRVSLWSTRDMTVEHVELTAADNPTQSLLTNGNFEAGLAPWFAHGGQVELSQEPAEGLELAPGASVTYTRFDGVEESLRAFPGQNVMLLIPHNDLFPVEDSVVESILARLDSSWELFERFTGFYPSSFADRVAEAPVTMPTLAVVESTCGAGCGMVSALGIEIGRGIWEETYENAVQGLGTRGVFEYEMGRNFWTFGSRLETADEPSYHMGTAFATIMGYLAGVAAGSTSEPGNGLVDWVETFRDGYQAYSENPDFNVLLAGGIDAERVHGGLWLHLMESETGLFLPRYFRSLLTLDSASNLDEAVANHVIASSVGVGENLTTFFELLDFPVPAGTSDAVDAALANQPILSMSNDVVLDVLDGRTNEVTPTINDSHPLGNSIPIQLLALEELEFDSTQVPPDSEGILLEPEAIPAGLTPIPYLVADPFGNYDQANMYLNVIVDRVFGDRFEPSKTP